MSLPGRRPIATKKVGAVLGLALADSDVVSVVGAGGHRDAADAIVAGHDEYPSFRYLFPDPARRAKALRAFFEATVRDAIRFRSVLAVRTGSRVDATAVWLPPGAFPWTVLRKLRAVPAFTRVLAADPRAFPSFARYGSIVEREHRHEACWYLVVLSVRPEAQRRGLGTQLIEPVLAHAYRAGVSCRLDTADPANVAYYNRCGFTVVEPALWVFRDGPPLIRMHRPAAATRGLR